MNVKSPPLLTSTKGMALECNMGHYEAEPHQLQLENDHAYYRWDGNHSTDTQAVWTSQGWNRRYRGWSSRQITQSHPRLSQNQAYNHTFTQPTRGRNAMGQRHHDWREHVQVNECFEQNEPPMVPDILVGSKSCTIVCPHLLLLD